MLLRRGSVDEKRLALYISYRTSHERAFHKCLTELVRLRAEKKKKEIDFESQKCQQAEEARKQEKHEMTKSAMSYSFSTSNTKLIAPKNATALPKSTVSPTKRRKNKPRNLKADS